MTDFPHEARLIFSLCMELSLCDSSGITTKAPCEGALMSERHMRIEISDFVMRTFVLADTTAAFLCMFLSSHRSECHDLTRMSRRPFYPIYDKSSKSYN